MLDGLGNLLHLACKFSEHIFRPGVSGVDRQFLLELLLGLLRQRTVRIGLREQKAPQAKVDAGGIGAVFQDPAVLRRSLLPLALNFQRLSVELMSLIGSRRRLCQLLRGTQRKVRVYVNC